MTSTLKTYKTFCGKAVFAGKMVNWFASEPSLAWKLAWQGNWFGRESSLARKLNFCYSC